MTRRMVIAIDGAAGSGKSTLARAIALELDLPYLNTGSMYRALTLEALRQGVDPDDEAPLVGLMRGLSFSLGREAGSELLIDGAEAEADLEGPEVEGAVSQVARHPGVRELMRRAQRDLGAEGSVVEGRDIGSVVFPDAAVKIFLVADPAARAARRARERRDADPAARRALHERDTKDATVNPFEPVPDAVVIDTGDLDPNGTLRVALAAIREQLERLEPPP